MVWVDGWLLGRGEDTYLRRSPFWVLDEVGRREREREDLVGEKEGIYRG